MPDTSLAIRKTMSEGRGYNQVGRELASDEWNPGLGPQHHRKPDLATQTCNSIVGIQKAGGSVIQGHPGLIKNWRTV